MAAPCLPHLHETTGHIRFDRVYWQTDHRIISHYPDRFQVLFDAGMKNVHRLAGEARDPKLKPELVVENADSAKELRGMISNSIEVMVGDEGLIAAATHPRRSWWWLL